MYTFLLIFFFFQAEDGIRDKLVTGVQTCALPISRAAGAHRGASVLGGDRELRRKRCFDAQFSGAGTLASFPTDDILDGVVRSEERRVGKECRSRWSPYH